jgi:hypothetical protein
MTNYCFSHFDDVGSKNHFLPRLNLIERCAASSSIENLKWFHFQTLLVAVVVRELGPRQILVPSSLVVHDTGSQHVFQDLVDSFHLAIRLWVVGRTMDQVSPKGCVQVLPKASDKLRTSIEDYRLWNSMQA